MKKFRKSVLLCKDSLFRLRVTVLKLTYLLSIVFVILCFDSFAEGKLNWRKIPIGINLKNFHFISAKSADDFWMENSQGFIYHFTDKQILKYQIPNSSKFTLFRFFKYSSDEFYIITQDKNYYSKIFHFNKNRFSISLAHSEVPLMGIINASGKLYAFGNWGSFYVLENDKWKKINTPIKNHIPTAVYDKNSGIFLGTRGEGIYLFDGKNFKKIPTENGNQLDLVDIFRDSDGQLYARALNDELIFDGKNFKSIQSSSIKNSRFGFHEMFLSDEFSRKSFLIPSEKEFTSGIQADDGTLLTINRQGDLFHSFKQNTNFFNRFDYTYQIEGHANENSIGASFIHLNEDFFPELFVLNTNNSSKLYLNQKNKNFIDLSLQLEKVNSTLIDKYIFADINSDYHLDFIGLNSSKRVKNLFVYYGDKKKNFSSQNVLLRNIPGDITNLRLADFNEDGDIDLVINQYLDSNRNVGNIIRLINQKYSNSLIIDSKNKNEFKSWNLQTIIADFNNDDLSDIYIVQKWRKDKLLFNQDGRYVDKASSNLNDFQPLNTFSAISFDYNNDGNLDILLLSEENIISLLENNGQGKFKDVSHKKIPENFLNPSLNQPTASFINSGDINNDGFVDIILYLKNFKLSKQFCLINHEGKYFKDLSDSLNLQLIDLNGNILADIDDDGDIDIYGFRNGNNILWLNNLDNKNFIKILVKGVSSNTQAIGAKIWIYKAGHLNKKKYLLGYKQIGSDIPGGNRYNDPMIHFGIPENRIDIKIKFPSGVEKFLYNIEKGQNIVVEEKSGISKAIYLFPGIVLRFFLNTSVQIYLLISLLSAIILFVGIRNGLRKYNWQLSLTIILVVINLSLFWTLIIITNEFESVIKYLLPPISVFIGIAMPNLIYFFIEKKRAFDTNEDNAETLFNLLINFSHGEWALRNLNSLQMFFQNIPAINTYDSSTSELLLKRRGTFIELTYPTLTKIIFTSQKIIKYNEISNELNPLCKNIYNNILNTDAQNINNQEVSAAIGNDIEKMKTLLTKLKHSVFADFSCGVTETINKVLVELNSLFESNSIKIIKEKMFDEETFVLIKNLDLADVIDNLIRNSVSALKNSSKKIIHIFTYKKIPKVFIEISDTGKGIDSDKLEKIFEYGYSDSGGTGKGLFLSRKILHKYGGRIYLKNSEPDIGSTFLIELNEGYHYETKSSDNR